MPAAEGQGYGVVTIPTALAWLAILAIPPGPGARDPVPTVVLPVAFQAPELEGLARAAERVLRQQVDKRPEVTARASPSLDLPALQLAIGCVGDDDPCLSQIADQLEAQEMIAPQLDRAGDTVVLSVLRYRGGAPTPRSLVVRQAQGSSRDHDLLQAIPGLVDELYGVSPAPPPAPPPGPIAVAPPLPPTEAESAPVAPWVTAGAGVVVTTVGLVLGATATSLEAEFAAAPVQTAEDVDRALGLLDRAETRATAANVVIGLGVVTAVAGVVWLVLSWPDDAAPVSAAGGGP